MEERTLQIDQWETPASSYREERIGDFRINRQVIETGRYYLQQGEHTYYRVSEPIAITHLQELRNNRWENWMLDSPGDFLAMQEYAAQASGEVLTSGLGLGLIASELCDNPNVTGITIVEFSPAVMALVGKYLPQDPRIKLVWGDFWKFVMRDTTAWSWIIADVWVYRGFERFQEVYETEVVPMRKYLGNKFPDAQTVFHGFENSSVFRGNLDKVPGSVRR